MSPRARGRWGAFALALASAVARGEERPPDVVEEIAVEGRRRSAHDPTAAATVVQADRFAGEAKDVAALIATAPGVAVHEYGGLGQLATVSIRGSMSSGVLVLLDGVPLESGGGGGTDLASIPRHWISRIEVLRGAEGAHFGAGALAGVVNVVTHRPEGGAWAAEAGYGSFGTAAAGGGGASAAGPWTLFAAGSLDATAGRFRYLYDPDPSAGPGGARPEVRTNNRALRGGVLVKADRPVGEGRLDLLAQLSAGRRHLAGPASHLTPDDWQEDARLLLSASLDLPRALGVLDLGLAAHARAERLDTALAPSPALRQRQGAGGAEAELALDHAGGRLRASLSAAGEAFSSAGLGGSRSRPRLGAGLAEEAKLLGGRLLLAPTLRAERVGPFSGLSAKLGAGVALRPWLSLRASGGRSFRAPSFSELFLQQGLVDPNPDLRPETSLGGDAALVAEGRLGLASLGVFAQLYRDLVLYRPSSFQRFKPFNAGRALVRGIEAELATAPAPALLGASASLAYTLLDSENLRAAAQEVGKALPFRARHRLYARIGIAPGPFELHGEAHYVGRQFRDPASTAVVPATLLWGAGASVRLARSPSTRLHLEVKNLADDRTLVDGLGNPLPSRMAMVTLRAGSTPEGAPAP